ncbi:hypothetical protein ACWCRD_00805 [Streptomyces sp. NPDC002092]
MAAASRTTTHRRVRTARKPVVAGLAANAGFFGARYATAGASTTAADGLSVTTASGVRRSGPGR